MSKDINEILNINNLLYIDEINLERCIKILKYRFSKKLIYTQLGAILLSINPYQYFVDDEDLYNFNNFNNFRDTVHLYNTMNNIIEKMFIKNQVIIVSGESGSGKTETTKQIIKYLNYHTSKDKVIINDELLDKILASGLVLETFGNASTQKNHNSSRFGKFIEVFYNNNRECVGMKTSIYLLEKVRIVEKNSIGRFHIFNKDRNKTEEILKKAGFIEENINFIFKIVDIVNEIINLDFKDNKKKVLYNLLIKTKINFQEEIIEKIYTEEEFNELRDILGMKLYEYLFNWIVEQMNIMYEVKEYNHKLGILDIFGFEDLENNSLEQLSINYANEIIQGLLNKILLEDKIKLYKEENVEISVETLQLNKEQIKLIEQIFITLDEECILPKGSDTNLITKFNNNYKNNKYYITHKTNNDFIFSIMHYAGKIDYKIKDFIKKNIDKINQDIDIYINNLFNQKTLKKKLTGKIKINSITNQFKNQLTNFLEIISESELHFIKCIKPNSNESALEYNDDIVKEQLIYNGVIQLINILKQGYGYHLDKKIFIKEYGNIYTLDTRNTVCTNILGIVEGKTKYFLTEEAYNQIKVLSNIFKSKNAILIQKTYKKYIMHKQYNKIKESINKIKLYWKLKLLRRRILRNKSSKIITNFIRYIINKKELNKKRQLSVFYKNIKRLRVRNNYINKLINGNYLITIIRRNLEHIILRKKIMFVIKIQKYWKIYKNRKNNILRKNILLEEELQLKNNNIYILEKKIIELEQKVIILEKELDFNKNKIEKISKSVPMVQMQNNSFTKYENEFEKENILEEYINIKDEYIYINDEEKIEIEKDNLIENLRDDIIKYQENIKNRLNEKITLISLIDDLQKKNKDLQNFINNNKTNWFIKLFNIK